MATSSKDSKPAFFNIGRYIHKKEITKINDWDSIFKHIICAPPSIYDTAKLIHNKEFNGHKSRYPHVMYIPLYCSLPGFRRCILHVETTDMDQLFIPVEITYHVNHPISNGIKQVLFNSQDNCTFITNNEIIYYYTVRSEDYIQKIKKLFNETDNFEEFEKTYKLPLSNLFPDPERIAYAKENIIYCDPNDDPIGAKESEKIWKEIVYPKSSKEAFSQFIFNQINIHQNEQIKWQTVNPEITNPFILPSDKEIVENPYFHKRHNLANKHISKLWKCLNENERLIMKD